MEENIIHLNIKDKWKDKFKKNPFLPLLFIILAAFTLWLFTSMVYSIGPEENGVILRFGKYHRTEMPGLHFKLPYVPGFLPIEEVFKVPVSKIHKFEIGYRTVSAGVKSRFEKNSRHKKESLMLTGDLNVADVEWEVQFKISNAKDFLFNVRNVAGNLFDISQAVMREVIGDRTVTEVLTTGTSAIEEETEDRMQKIIDEYNMGIKIVKVLLQGVNPPEKVKPSFNEVNSAKQEAKQAINEAERDYKNIIPEARGKAEKTIADAEAYKTELVNTAEGDANRFQSMYQEFKKAPQVTKKRLYFEMMQRVLNDAKDVTIIDPEFKNLVPLLNIKGEKS